MTQQAIEAALLEENRLRCDPPLSNDEVSGIARSISKYPVSSYDLLSASSKNEEAAETNLKFRTGVEIANETADEVPWSARPYVASGALTEVDAKVKLRKNHFLDSLGQRSARRFHFSWPTHFSDRSCVFDRTAPDLLPTGNGAS